MSTPETGEMQEVNQMYYWISKDGTWWASPYPSYPSQPPQEKDSVEGFAQTSVAQGPVETSDRSTLAPCEVAEESDMVEGRLSASAARRLRRKRAAERSREARPETDTVYKETHNEGPFGASNSRDLTLDELRDELHRNPVQGIQCLRGQVWRLSRDAVGCRLVQEALELGSKGVVDLAHELQGHVLEAVMCPNANYVVQKVVSHLSVAASSFVAWELQGNAVRAAKHRFACRIFCRLLEFCGTGPTSQLVDEFLDAAEENLCTHSFAHHVVQSILEHGEERHKRLIAKMLMADLWKHATHKNSSYLIEKALCYCDDEDQNSLIANLGYPQALLDLAMTQYGSFVARALLQDSRVNADLATRHIRRHQGDLESTKHGHRFLIDIGLEQ